MSPLWGRARKERLRAHCLGLPSEGWGSLLPCLLAAAQAGGWLGGPWCGGAARVRGCGWKRDPWWGPRKRGSSLPWLLGTWCARRLCLLLSPCLPCKQQGLWLVPSQLLPAQAGCPVLGSPFLQRGVCAWDLLGALCPSLPLWMLSLLPVPPPPLSPHCRPCLVTPFPVPWPGSTAPSASHKPQ